jgi:hypothetical protein
MPNPKKIYNRTALEQRDQKRSEELTNNIEGL